MIEVFKNPVVLGVLSGILVYVGMAWSIKSKQNKNKKKKHVKIHFPIIVAILIGVMAHYYFKQEESSEEIIMFNMQMPMSMPMRLPSMEGGMKNNLMQHNTIQPTSNLFGGNRVNGEFVTKGISIPNKIPETFSTEHF